MKRPIYHADVHNRFGCVVVGISRAPADGRLNKSIYGKTRFYFKSSPASQVRSVRLMQAIVKRNKELF